MGDASPRDELTQALGVHLEHPVLRAILQLIDTAEDNANRAAADDPRQRDKYIGGAEQMRLLRDDILARRENVLKLRKLDERPPRGN